MKRIGLGVIVCLAACGSSSDDGAANAEPGSSDSAGSMSPAQAGAGGAKSGSGGGVALQGGAGNGSAGGSTQMAGAAGTAGGAGRPSDSGAGGSGGSPTAGSPDGGPPHVIGKCDGLGAIGVWENITPPNVAPAMFVVDPVNAGTVYAGTGDPKRGGVFKSSDCGASWTHISTGRNGDGVDSGGQWTMAIDPNDPKILYTNSGYGRNGLFKSTNGGVDWDDVTPKGNGAPGFVGNLQMDPEDSKHLLMTWHSNCGNYADGIGCFAETKDGGATWTEHYGTPSWPGQVRVLLLHGSTWIVLADQMLLTRDGGATFTTVSGTAAGGHSSGTLSRMKNGDYYVGYMYGLIRSPASSNAATWTTLDNTGQWVGDVVESATMRFATHQQGLVTQSSVTDGVKWKDMPGSPKSEFAGYDRDHHILYVEGSSQMWRVVTE
jgi:hypothetical protein